MHRICVFTLVVVSLVTAGTMAARQASRPPPPQQPSQSGAPPAAAAAVPSTDESHVLKVKTRLVTIDLTATDARGNPILDLKPEEIHVTTERNSEQKVAHFEFFGGAAVSAAPAVAASAAGSSPKVYSNQIVFQRLKVPPTILLLDALNTTTQNQLDVHKHMVRLLKTLPPDTPAAVILMTSRLRVIQNFTTDPALLQAAVAKLTSASQLETNPSGNSNSALNGIEIAVADELADAPPEAAFEVLAELEDFFKEEYASSVDTRVFETTDALKELARFVDGIPGRKNLIWISESFPMSLYPDADSGRDTFAGTRAYADKVEAAANALTDAQVAVYPVNVNGLQETSIDASQDLIVSRGAPSGQFAAQINRQRALAEDARQAAQQTMDNLADNTGGRTCKNTNDLSACVQTVLKDSSSYYELDFYPQDVKWDGTFHKVVVKTTRRGVTLKYRHGYFALDEEAAAKGQKPDDILRQACSDILPATAIHLAARVSPGDATRQNELRYQVSIAPDALTLIPKGASQAINLQAAVCQFSAKGDSFHFSRQDLGGTVPDVVLQKWQAQGFPDALVVQPEADTRRIRFAVLDVPTGLTGAVDIPVLAGEAEKTAAVPPTPAPAATPTPAPAAAPPVNKSLLEIPDKGLAQGQPTATLSFHSPSGDSGTLDWTGDSLVYRGDLAAEDSAPAFFDYAFGSKFACRAGTLAPLDPDTGQAKLLLTLRNHDGKSATVDLSGDAPRYSGTLPVDATAKELFAQVWLVAHCR